MNKPIRVLQVFSIMNMGGAENMIMNYYRRIDRNEVQFDFLVHRTERGVFDDEIEQLGGKIFRIPPIYYIQRYPQAVRDFFATHTEYKIVHGHVGSNGYYIYKTARRYNIPVVISHAHSTSCNISWKWPIATLFKHLTRSVITHPFACGRKAAKWTFGKELASRAQILPNAIDSPSFAYSREKENRTKKSMGWENRFVVGYVARFYPPKNHFRILNILQELIKQQPNVLLVLVGAKIGYYEKLQQVIERKCLTSFVQFTGVRHDVSELLQGFDIVLFPSLAEGFSVAMLEAQASGLKVIASDSIDQESAICSGLVDFVSLKEPNTTWVSHLLTPYKRRDTSNIIVQAGFDINNNVKKLQNFYLEHHNEK